MLSNIRHKLKALIVYFVFQKVHYQVYYKWIIICQTNVNNIQNIIRMQIRMQNVTYFNVYGMQSSYETDNRKCYSLAS